MRSTSIADVCALIAHALSAPIFRLEFVLLRVRVCNTVGNATSPGSAAFAQQPAFWALVAFRNVLDASNMSTIGSLALFKVDPIVCVAVRTISHQSAIARYANLVMGCSFGVSARTRADSARSMIWVLGYHRVAKTWKFHGSKVFVSSVEFPFHQCSVLIKRGQVRNVFGQLELARVLGLKPVLKGALHHSRSHVYNGDSKVSWKQEFSVRHSTNNDVLPGRADASKLIHGLKGIREGKHLVDEMLQQEGRRLGPIHLRVPKRVNDSQNERGGLW